LLLLQRLLRVRMRMLLLRRHVQRQ